MQKFEIGHSYALDDSMKVDGAYKGYIKAIAELKPTDDFGIRVLLVDCHTTDGLHLLGKRLFVESGITERKGEHYKTEIGILQGIFPYVAKAYAIDQMIAEADDTSENVA